MVGIFRFDLVQSADDDVAVGIVAAGKERFAEAGFAGS